MAHVHFHGEESVRNYFTEQLLTILVCGLFAFAAIQMYRNDRLGFLTPQFHLPVLLGGIGIGVLVILRMVSVWREAGQLQGLGQDSSMACGQDHVHGPDCNHANGLPDTDPDHTHDDHGHSHDLSWVFARMLVLIFPIILFFLGLPSASFSQAYLDELVGNDTALGAESLKQLAKTATPEGEPQKLPDGSIVRILLTPSKLRIRETTPANGGEPKYEQVLGDATRMRFNDLKAAAFSPSQRDTYQGRTVIMEGRFKRLADKEFTLYRLKMACCAADAVPLKVRIVVPQSLGSIADSSWVEVKGQIQFRKPPGSEHYIPVIMVADISDVKDKKTPPPNEYEE